MPPIIATTVVVQDDQFQNHIYLPGDNVPDWAAARITTPGVWDETAPTPVAIGFDGAAPLATSGDDVPPAPIVASVIGEDAATSDVPPAAAEAGQIPSVTDGQQSSAPPKSGPAATVDAWTAFARGHGVPVPADATRKQIIAALTDAGIPTE